MNNKKAKIIGIGSKERNIVIITGLEPCVYVYLAIVGVIPKITADKITRAIPFILFI